MLIFRPRYTREKSYATTASKDFHLLSVSGEPPTLEIGLVLRAALSFVLQNVRSFAGFTKDFRGPKARCQHLSKAWHSVGGINVITLAASSDQTTTSRWTCRQNHPCRFRRCEERPQRPENSRGKDHHSFLKLLTQHRPQALQI